MDLHHLKTFMVLAKLGNFSRAAEELFLTQPAVSIHIKSLEEYYGFPLFQKLDQKYVLTEPGKILYEYAVKIFNIINESKRSLDGYSKLNAGSLFIGASSNIGVYILPKLLGEFKKQFPNIELKVSIGPTYVIEKQLLSHEIDVGIVEAPTRSTSIVVDFQWEENLILIVSPKHTWVQLKQIEPSNLTDEFFVSGERGSGTRRVMEETLGGVVKDIKIFLELGSTEAVKKAVEENLGISIVMECSVTRELKQKTLEAIIISGVNLKKKISVIHVKGKFLTPSFNEFVKYLHHTYSSR